MKIKNIIELDIGRCDTLWFFTPSICVDIKPRINRLEIAIVFLNWQFYLNVI